MCPRGERKAWNHIVLWIFIALLLCDLMWPLMSRCVSTQVSVNSQVSFSLLLVTFSIYLRFPGSLKVAEHSFSARFCWCKLARAQGFQKTNMPSTERSFYCLNTRTICVIFLYNCMQFIDGFSILLQRYVIKGNDAKNPAFFSFCLLPKEPS